MSELDWHYGLFGHCPCHFLRECPMHKCSLLCPENALLCCGPLGLLPFLPLKGASLHFVK